MRFFDDNVRESDVQGNIWDELEYYLCRKSQNDKALPKKLLETKYKKNYDRMKNNIWSRFMKVSEQYCFGGLLFAKTDNEEAAGFAATINRMVEDAKQQGIFRHAQRYLFDEYDLNKALSALNPLKDRVTEAYRQGYWNKNCIRVNATNFPYYNKVIDMYFSLESNTWMREHNGTMEFMEMLPPPCYNTAATV